MSKKIYSLLIFLSLAGLAYGGLVYNPMIHNNMDMIQTIEEEDGSPSVPVATIIKVTNGTLTDNADGTVSLANIGAEVDTLDTVSDRGATTNQSLTMGGLTVDSNIVNLSDTTDEYVLAFDVGTQTWRGIAIAGGGDMLASTYDPAGISEQLVGLVAIQTLTNKTLAAANNVIEADTVTNGVYTTDNISALSATTSAQLFGVLSDETGSGAGALAVFNISPTFETSILGNYLTASEILITDASKNIVSAPVATYPSLTELSYVKGVTSAVQTQLNKTVTLSKAFVILDPVATDDVPLWEAPYALTLTAIHVQCTGGTNIIGGLDEYNSAGAAIVAAVDADITATAGASVDDDGSLTNGTIAAGNYLFWHTTSISGTPTSVTVSFNYQVD